MDIKMVQFLLNIISSTVVSAALVGIAAWLARSWLSERISNAIRAEYDQKLETHKAQLKAQSDVALEKLRADLSIKSAERQIQLTRLHETRAEVIAETYAQLVELRLKLGDYVKLFEPSGDKSKDERRKAVQEAHEAFISFYPKKRIFLPDTAVKKIDAINQQSVEAFYSFFYEIETLQQQGTPDTRRWYDIFKQVRDEIPDALCELKNEFRILLGDVGS